MSGIQPTGRRGFIGRLLALFAAISIPNLWSRASWAARKVAIPLDKVGPLKEVGGGAILTIKDIKVLLIRKDEQSVSAIYPACKHKECQVLYKKEWGEIRCKCHKSKYDLSGKVMNPPAKQDLDVFPVQFDGSRIVLELPDTPPPPPKEKADDGEVNPDALL